MLVFPKTPIDLETTSMEFKFLVSSLVVNPFDPLSVAAGGGQQDIFFVKGKPRTLTDFGCVFVIKPNIQISQKTFASLVEATCTPRCPVFTAPFHWRMPQVLRALQAFGSAQQAMNNGWDIDIPEGIEEHFVRINKIKGVVTTIKVSHCSTIE